MEAARTKAREEFERKQAEIKENNALIAGLCESERELVDVVLVPIISPYAEIAGKSAAAVISRIF